jgi:hypothetical protein
VIPTSAMAATSAAGAPQGAGPASSGGGGGGGGCGLTGFEGVILLGSALALKRRRR